MPFRPKLTILVAILVSIPTLHTFNAGYISVTDLLTRVLLSLAISFIGITVLSYMLAIFTAQSFMQSKDAPKLTSNAKLNATRAIELDIPSSQGEVNP